MKKLTLVLMLISVFGWSQSPEEQKLEIRKFQTELNRSYKDREETPLRGDNFKNFKQHPFFPVDLKYRVTAQFTKTENALPFELPTSSGETQPYREFGKIHFGLEGKTYVLTVYQSLNLIRVPGYEDHLFLPFRDGTNGKETYGGGKYLDLRTPEGAVMVIDFNQSYHPYCAYNANDYSCPVVPGGNVLPVRIEAGVQYEDVYFDYQ